MTPFVLQRFAETGAGALADSLVLGILVAFAVWAILGVLRRHSAGARHSILIAALASLALLPVLRTLASGGGSAGASLIHLSGWWAVAVASLWAIGATITLARIVIGILGVRRLRRNSVPLTLSPEIAGAVHSACPSRRFELLLSDAVSVPSAIGFLHPAIVIPAWLPDDLSESELRHILVHEASHLQRRDDWTNLFQQVVKAIFFFHPAVWWMENRLALEREMACDDAVMAQCESPRGYAECLVRLAEKGLLRRGFALAQAAVSRVRQTSQRVARILKFENSAHPRCGKLGLSLATVLALAGYGAVLQAPTVVSFSDIDSPSWSRPLLAQQGGTVPRSIDAVWHAPKPAAVKHSAVKPDSAPEVQTVLKHAQPAVRPVQAELEPVQPHLRAVQAHMTSPTAREVTYILVVQQQNAISVWRITTWQFVPSRQIRTEHRTT